MGGRASGLVVAGVVILAALAAVDALRGEEEVQRPPGGGTTTTTGRPASTTGRNATATGRTATLPETLRREAITGFALYSDEACRLHWLALPSMDEYVVRKEGTNEPIRRCTFGVEAGRVLPDDAFLSPDRTQVVRCRRAHVEVLDALSDKLQSRVRGCAPAWRPDGALTYARGERVLLGGRIVLLSSRDLHAAVRRLPSVAELGTDVEFKIRVVALAWLDVEHLVASLEIRVPYMGVQPLAVLFRGKAIVTVAAGFQRRLGSWIVSSAGSFAAAPDGTIMARDGDSVAPPQNLPDGRAVAFSPDEQWLAYATGVSVYLVGTPRNSEPARIIRLPIPAQDLGWEPLTPGP